MISAVFAAGWGLGLHQAKITAVATAKVMTGAHLDANKSAAQARVWNPSGALANILKKYAGGERILAVARLVEATPVSELALLIAEAESSPDDSLRHLVDDLAYAKWVAIDPEGALANALPAMQKGKPELTEISSILGMWARKDPRAALAAALKLDHAAFRQDGVSKVLNHWICGDSPLEALAAFKSLPPDATIPKEARWLFQRWAEVDPLAAFANLGQITDEDQRQDAQGIILGILAYSNPVKAVSLLRDLPVGQQSPQVFMEVFQTWARQDHDAALAEFHALPAGESRVAAAEGVFNGWSEIDPLAALRAAQEFSPGPERTKALDVTLPNVFLQNPQAGGEYLASLPASGDLNRLVNTMVAGLWADADPASALAWLDKNIVGPARDQAVGDILGKMTTSDPTAAIAYIIQLPAGPARDKYLQSSLGLWGKQDPATAIAWVYDNLTDSARDTAVATVLPLLIQANPRLAMDYVNQLPEGQTRDKAIASLAVSMATEDIQEAITWVQNLPSEVVSASARNAALAGVIKTWANVDPASAAAFAQNYVSDTDSNPLVTSVVQALAQSNSQVALAWAESLPAGASRERAIGTTLQTMAAVDAPVAWDHAVSHLQSDGYLSPFPGIIATWARTDPAAAAQAVAALPDGALGTRYTNIASIFTSEWMNRDPAALAEFIEKTPPGSFHDAVAARFNQLQQAYDLGKRTGGIIFESSSSVTVMPMPGFSPTSLRVGMGVPRDDDLTPREPINIPLVSPSSNGVQAGLRPSGVGP